MPSPNLRLQIQRLEAELAEYRSAFTALLASKVELAAAIDGQPSREALVIQVATLREALWWASSTSYALNQGQASRVAELASYTTSA